MRNVSHTLRAHLGTLTLSQESGQGQLIALQVNSAMAHSWRARADYALLHGEEWVPLPEYGALLVVDDATGQEIGLEVLDVQEDRSIELTASRQACTVAGRVRLSATERARCEALFA